MAEIQLRVDSRSPEHTRITVFGHGANCGTLCLRNDEYDYLCRALSKLADARFERDNACAAADSMARRVSSIALDRDEYRAKLSEIMLGTHVEKNGELYTLLPVRLRSECDELRAENEQLKRMREMGDA